MGVINNNFCEGNIICRRIIKIMSVTITFNYQGNEYIIEGNPQQKMKEFFKELSLKINKDINKIYFLYNSDCIDGEKNFCEQANDEDKRDKKMIVIVNDIDDSLLKTALDEIYFLCPICNEYINFNIKDYRINLYGCKNGHKINDILLNKYEEIKANRNNIKNMKKILINNNYICPIHNEKFIGYCEDDMFDYCIQC